MSLSLRIWYGALLFSGLAVLPALILLSPIFIIDCGVEPVGAQTVVVWDEAVVRDRAVFGNDTRGQRHIALRGELDGCVARASSVEIREHIQQFRCCA